MNKKACLVLLAVAAQQSSMMASWNWKKQNTQQPTPSTAQTDVPTPKTPEVLASEARFESPSYQTNQELKQELRKAKDEFTELEQKSELQIAELRNKNDTLAEENDDLAQQVTWTKRKAMFAATAMLAVGVAIGHYTK